MRPVTRTRLLLLCLLLGSSVILSDSAQARRVKVYTVPKKIAPGKLGIIIFENPISGDVKSISKCTAEKLIAWVKSDIPILRIEQKGKQVWTSLGSYQSHGDTAIASFMAPLSLDPGPATLFVVNEHDPSVPIPFAVVSEIESTLTGIEGTGITPLAQFRVIGDGFVPATLLDTKNAKEELEGNVGLSKMPKAEQWTVLNHRIVNDWDRVPLGDFLFIEQGGKTWQTFVDQCSLSGTHLALDFTAPPDLAKGPAKIELHLRMNGKLVEKTPPITVTVL